MKKFFVMRALAWGTVGACAQNEADSVAAVNNAITLAKDVYPQKAVSYTHLDVYKRQYPCQDTRRGRDLFYL